MDVLAAQDELNKQTVTLELEAKLALLKAGFQTLEQ